MFGTNSITGQSHFNDLGDTHLKVTSCFATLQGEGPYSGRRAVFLRLAKCNLACSFCFPSFVTITARQEDGSVVEKPMSQLQRGDELFTVKDGEGIWTTVYNINRRMASSHEVMRLTYRLYDNTEHSMLMTKEHPIGHPSNAIGQFKWTRAWDLNIGDKILAHTLSGEYTKEYAVATVTGVDTLNSQEWRDLQNTCAEHDVPATATSVEVISPTCAPFNHFFVGDLHCHNCDTHFETGDTMSIDQVVELLKTTVKEAGWSLETISRGTKPILVITGGEPTLQQPALVQLLDHLMYNEEPLFSAAQIESNGIIPFHNFIARHCTLVVSPKCSEKDGKPTKYIKPHRSNMALQDLYLKFVVTADETSPYHELPVWADEFIDMGRVYVSPMNMYLRMPEKQAALKGSSVDMQVRSTVDEVVSFWEVFDVTRTKVRDDRFLDIAQNEANHKHAAKICMERGFLLSLQMHLYVGLA